MRSFHDPTVRDPCVSGSNASVCPWAATAVIPHLYRQCIMFFPPMSNPESSSWITLTRSATHKKEPRLIQQNQYLTQQQDVFLFVILNWSNDNICKKTPRRSWSVVCTFKTLFMEDSVESPVNANDLHNVDTVKSSIYSTENQKKRKKNLENPSFTRDIVPHLLPSSVKTHPLHFLCTQL